MRLFNISVTLVLAGFVGKAFAQNSAFKDYSQALVVSHYSCSLDANIVWISNETANLTTALDTLSKCISASEAAGNQALKTYSGQTKGKVSTSVKRMHASWLAALRSLQPQSGETKASHTERRSTAYGRFQEAQATAEVDLLQ